MCADFSSWFFMWFGISACLYSACCISFVRSISLLSIYFISMFCMVLHVHRNHQNHFHAAIVPIDLCWREAISMTAQCWRNNFSAPPLSLSLFLFLTNGNDDYSKGKIGHETYISGGSESMTRESARATKKRKNQRKTGQRKEQKKKNMNGDCCWTVTDLPHLRRNFRHTPRKKRKKKNW